MFGMRNSITSYIIHPVHIIKWDYDVGSYGSPDIPIPPPQKKCVGSRYGAPRVEIVLYFPPAAALNIKK